MYLPDEHHERLWRICDALVTGAGARGAMLCEANGAIVLSVGDLSAQGAPTGVTQLSPSERLVRGEGGNVYGVELPGGILLAVLHEPSVFEKVRAAAAETVRQTLELLETVPPPPPPPPIPGHEDAHPNEAPRTKTRARASTKKPPLPPPGGKGGLGGIGGGERAAGPREPKKKKKSAQKEKPAPKKKPASRKSAKAPKSKVSPRPRRPARRRSTRT